MGPSRPWCPLSSPPSACAALLACANCLSPVVPANEEPLRPPEPGCVQLVLKEAPLSVMVVPVPIPVSHPPCRVPLKINWRQS